MVDLTKYKEKFDAIVQEYRNNEPSGDPIGAFLAELAKAGFEVPKHFEAGKILRIKAPDDKRHKSGWCWYEEVPDTSNDGYMIGVGAYGSWRDESKVTWSSRKAEYLTKEQSTAMQLRREEMRKKRDDDEKIMHAETAVQCWQIFSEAQPADANHPYLARKQIAPYGLKQAEGKLIVPMLSDGDVLTSLQFIQADGFKPYKKGGKVKGCYFRFDGTGSRIYVVEGYATGASVYQATGATVYVAFNAGNLYEVANYVTKRHESAEVVIAGDDDIHGKVNTGRTKAEEVAHALGIVARFPEFQDAKDYTDWNDLHCAEGLEVVREQLNRTYAIYKRKDDDLAELPKMDGVLADIMAFYRLTDVRSNELLAYPCALTLCSVVLARNFSTSKSNRTSIMQVVVSGAGTGKEHSDKVLTKILNKANIGHLIQGKGYTSGSGVFTKLLDRPRHIVMPNEWGIFLEGFTGRNVDANKLQIKGELLEASTKLDGIQRPNNYSVRGLKKAEVDELNRVVKNPAITLLGSTTPAVLDLFNAKLIQDGFVSRHIIWWSDKPLVYARDVSQYDVPQSILSWIDAITARLGARHETADEEPELITLAFEDDAVEVYKAYDREVVDFINTKKAAAELFVRVAEMALRLSLIIELSRNPNAVTVTAQSVQAGVDIMRYTSMATLNKLKRNMAGSDFEKWKLQCLEAIREKGAAGIDARMMKKEKPFSTLRPRDFGEVMKDLLEAELIAEGSREATGKGRPKKFYFAIDELK